MKCCVSDCEHVWDELRKDRACAKCFEMHPEIKRGVLMVAKKYLEDEKIVRGSDLWLIAQRVMTALGYGDDE